LFFLSILLSCGAGKEYEKVRPQETAAPYENFLERYGKSKYAPEARTRLNAVYQLKAYKSAREMQSTAGYKQFLRDYPASRLVGRAREELAVIEEGNAWKSARNTSTVVAYEIYLRRYSGGKHALEARAKAAIQTVTDEWDAAREKDTEAALRRFIDANPSDGRVTEAETRIIRVRQKSAWDATSFSDSYALERFVREHPEAPEADKARSQIKKIQDEKAWKVANTAATAYSYRAYLSQWPLGRHRTEATDGIKEIEVYGPAWRRAEQENSPEGYALFIRKNPGSSRTYQARQRKSELAAAIATAREEARLVEARKVVEKREQKLAAEEAAAERKRKAEITVWERAGRSKTVSAYKRYARDYPYGRYIDEVEEKIVDLEVAAIFRGDHGKLPAMQRTSFGNSYSSTTSIEVKNDTKYTLTVRYSGPSSKKIEIPKGGTRSFSLSSGSYRVTASVRAANVQNYAGRESLSGGEYSSKFYIETTTSNERY
jgi:hypothetical protein